MHFLVNFFLSAEEILFVVYYRNFHNSLILLEIKIFLSISLAWPIHKETLTIARAIAIVSTW